MKLSWKKVLESHKNIVMTLWAALAVMAVNANETLIVGAESDNMVLNFVSKLAMAFSTYNFVDVLSFVGVFLLLKSIYKTPGRFNRTGAVTSAFLTFCYVWSFSYKNTNGATALFGNSFQIFLTIFMCIGFFLLFYAVFECFCVALEKTKIEGEEKTSRKKLFFGSAATIFLGWLPWLVMNYPGSVAGDTIGQLGQYFSGQMNAHHPPLSTFLLGGGNRIRRKTDR